VDEKTDLFQSIRDSLLLYFLRFNNSSLFAQNEPEPKKK
jgi:hypothetical protein